MALLSDEVGKGEALLDVYLGGWAQPFEPLPFHILWPQVPDVERVELLVPFPLEIVELINVREGNVVQESNHARHVIDKTIAGCYLSGLVRYAAIPETSSQPIEMICKVFTRDDEFTAILTGRIIRPVLQISSAPKTLEVRENDPLVIEVEILHTGQSMAKVTYDIVMSGVATTEKDDLVNELLKRIARRSSPQPIPEGQELALEVDTQLVLDAVEGILQALDRDDHLTKEQLGDLLEVKESLNDQEFRDQLAKIVHTQIEQLWISSVLDYLQKNPEEDIEIQQGATRAVFNHDIGEVEFVLHYVDGRGTAYPDLRHTIQVKDLRDDKRPLEVPVQLRWKREINDD